MPMAKFDVDTTAKLFIAKVGIISFDVKTDLYSDAKEHWLAGGVAAGFNFPVRVIGGDPIGGGQFAGDLYFLRDGWKLRPQEADHTLLVTGSLFLEDGEVGELVVPTLGDYTVLVMGVRSNLVVGTSTTNATAAAVWDYLLHAGFSAERIMQIMAAALAGKSSGGPINPVFRDLTDTEDMITGTADQFGNRSAAVYGGS